MRNRVYADWKRVLDWYRGRYFDFESSDEQIVVNLVAGIVELMVPTLYFQDPAIIGRARRPGDERGAKLTEVTMNYYLDELESKKQIRKCIIDAMIYGIGYAKLGWEVDVERGLFPVTDQVTGQPLETQHGKPIYEDKHGNIFLEEGGRFVQVLDKEGNAVPPGYAQPTLHEWIRREQPYGIRWSPWDFLKDPEAKYADLSDARWIAFRVIMPLEEAKAHPLFSNTSSLEGTEIVRPELHEVREKQDKTVVDPDIQRVELFEIWCKEWNPKTKQYEMYTKVIARGFDKFLMNRKSPFVAEGFPVEVLTFTDDPESANPPSLFRFIESQLKTINDTRSQLATHRARFNRRYLANSNVLDEEDAKAVAKAEDGSVTLIDVDPEVDLRKQFVPIEDAPMNQEVYNDYNLALEEIQRILGLSDYQMAGQGPVRQATEANFIQGNFNIRIQDKQARVGDFLKGWIRYWTQLFKQFGDYETALKITNDLGEDEWVVFTIAEEIPDDLNFEIDIYTSNFQSKEVERNDSQNLYNLFRNDPMINPVYLIQKVAHAYGEKEVQRVLMPQQPPPVPGQEGVESAESAGQAVDLNALRQPPALDPGATGRAASGRG